MDLPLRKGKRSLHFVDFRVIFLRLLQTSFSGCRASAPLPKHQEIDQ